MLECSDITAAEQAWEVEQEEKQQEHQQALYEQQRLKKQLVEKFDLIKVSDVTTMSRKKPLEVWPPNKDKQPTSKVILLLLMFPCNTQVF